MGCRQTAAGTRKKKIKARIWVVAGDVDGYGATEKCSKLDWQAGVDVARLGEGELSGSSRPGSDTYLRHLLPHPAVLPRQICF